MSIIKKDVTDKDIENLFDNNNNEAFADETSQESFVPDELSVSNGNSKKIERPDEYLIHEVRQKKIDERKETESLLSSSHESLLKVNGSVGKDVFNEIAKARKQAQLDEFITKQRKLPVIQPNARYKLYDADPKCTFHVYQPVNIMDGNRYLCSCKFCSNTKIFTETQWKQYELENRQYM